MTALLALLRTEALLYRRQGILAAALVLSLVWAALLQLLPMAERLFWFGLVAGMDVTAMGLLFGFGLGLLDQQQGTLQAWRLTPAPAGCFTLARALMLTLLLMVSLTLLACLTLPPEHWWPRLPGLVLLSAQSALVGIVCGRLLRDINQFIVLMTLTGPFWALPFLGYSGVLPGPWPWMWPMSAGLYWLGEHPWQSPWLLVAVTSGALVWAGLEYWLSERLAPLHLGHRFGRQP